MAKAHASTLKAAAGHGGRLPGPGPCHVRSMAPSPPLGRHGAVARALCGPPGVVPTLCMAGRAQHSRSGCDFQEVVTSDANAEVEAAARISGTNHPAG